MLNTEGILKKGAFIPEICETLDTSFKSPQHEMSNGLIEKLLNRHH